MADHVNNGGDFVTNNNSNTRAIAIFTTYMITNISLTALIVRDLIRVSSFAGSNISDNTVKLVQTSEKKISSPSSALPEKEKKNDDQHSRDNDGDQDEEQKQKSNERKGKGKER